MFINGSNYDASQTPWRQSRRDRHPIVEQLMRNARHIEVQIIGDGKEVSHPASYRKIKNLSRK